jgi:diaminopimelate decarboxylase
MKDPFTYHDQELWCENVPLSEIARFVGTPCYVYSFQAIVDSLRSFKRAFSEVEHLICYAVKANSSLTVLRIVAREGCGADVVSGGELYQALKAKIEPSKIVYSGVGKSQRGIEEAIGAEILMINLESIAEIELLSRIVQQTGRQARLSFRINPDIDPKTHPYISTALKKNKFGLEADQALRGYKQVAKLAGLETIGIHMHLGSQMIDLGPIADALELILSLVKRLRREGLHLEYINIGGGLGIDYGKEKAPGPDDLAKFVLPLIRRIGMKLILEPGRAIVGKAGLLLTKVLYCKTIANKRFVVVDAGMNDLIRPCLYDAYHEVRAVFERGGEHIVDIVGPVCESADFFALDRKMPPLQQGDLLAIMDVGAYGFSMASNYNSRPRAAEVLVRGEEYFVIRKRETHDDLIRLEQMPDFLKKD